MASPTAANAPLLMILLNIAAALLLWWLLIREAKLSPLLAALAAAPFAMAPFITSAHLVEAQGGNVEPFLWVLVIWVLRDRPPWLGIVLGIAFLNREFTIYAVPALLAVQMMQSRGRVPSLVRPWLITAVCFAIVLVVVSMLAYYGHGKGMRTTLVTATRGEGGQNEIGPELFEALAVLRTEELLAAHRYDGAEQYFTRAVDFGFSFSVEETLEKWGHQEILGDYVRMIRTIRPQVIVGFVFDGEGGGQHHQTSSRLTAEAFRAAADPNQFPEQIKEGLRPWQATKFYYTAGFGPGGGRGGPQQFNGPGASKPLMFTGGADYDHVLGRTYNELQGEARSMVFTRISHHQRRQHRRADRRPGGGPPAGRAEPARARTARQQPVQDRRGRVGGGRSGRP